MTREYQFDPDEFSEELDEQLTEQPKQSPQESRIGLTGVISFALLPVIIAGVYAFEQSAAVLTAMEALIGTSGLASAVTLSLQLVGGLTVGLLAVFSVVGIVALLAGAMGRSVERVVFGLISLLPIIFGALGSTLVFTGLPLLVGAVLSIAAVIFVALIGAACLSLMLAMLSL
jgi:hypothetical protein